MESCQHLSYVIYFTSAHLTKWKPNLQLQAMKTKKLMEK